MINKECELPIILLQWNQSINSKNYLYFDSREQAIDHIFKLYEQFISDDKESVKIVDMTDVLVFIFSFYDFAYMEFDRLKGVYISYGKDWFSKILINSILVKN